jgi:hypothetical protein
MSETTTLGTTKHELVLEKQDPGQPVETIRVVVYCEADGTVIEDPERIAQIERAQQEVSRGEAD